MNVSSGLEPKEEGSSGGLSAHLSQQQVDDLDHILIETFVGVEDSGSGRGAKEGAGMREGRKEGRRKGGTEDPRGSKLRGAAHMSESVFKSPC